MGRNTTKGGKNEGQHSDALRKLPAKNDMYGEVAGGPRSIDLTPSICYEGSFKFGDL